MTGAQALIAGLVDDLVAGDPLLATTLGSAEGLGQLPAYSPAAVAARVARAHRAIGELTPVRGTAAAGRPVPDADAADAAVVIQVMRRFLRLYELRRVHETRPNLYLETIVEALLSVMLRELAPLDERVQAVLRRLGAVPDFLEEAQAQPASRAAARRRRERRSSSPTVFVTSSGPRCWPLPPRPDRRARSTTCRSPRSRRSRPSSRTCERLLPVSVDTCAAGRAVLEDVRVHEHMLDETPEQIAAYGRSVLAETQGEMAALATGLGFDDVEAAVAAARDDHPSLEGLVGAYREAVEAARAFVVSRGLVTLPQGERLAVIPTPAYLRAVLPFAAYMPPGPMAEEQLGYYLVTPPASGLAPAELEQALRGHPECSRWPAPASTRRTRATTSSSRGRTGRPPWRGASRSSTAAARSCCRGLGLLLRGDDGAPGLPRRARWHG